MYVNVCRVWKAETCNCQGATGKPKSNVCTTCMLRCGSFMSGFCVSLIGPVVCSGEAHASHVFCMYLGAGAAAERPVPLNTEDPRNIDRVPEALYKPTQGSNLTT